jgi:6-phosphogluconolactonase (cycloisomerase 2 family)
VTVDPSGKFVYVTAQTSGNVSAYALDPITGALASILGSPFPAGRGATSVVITGTIQ